MQQPAQVEALVELGVDAVGVILHADSPRTISLEQAREIRAVLPAFVDLVGVFVNADHEFLHQAIEVADLDLVQLHGDESSDFAAKLPCRYIKAVRAKTAEQVRSQMDEHYGASAILLDPYVKGQHGGTGQLLNTDCWPEGHQHNRLILAGGLSPENMAHRVIELQPYAVDINSGVESSPGVKDLALVTRAILAVQSADSQSKCL